MKQLYKRLKVLAPEVLTTLQRGIEKEGLRVSPDGMLAQTPHPAALGSPLTHPHITTDFSESQLELITGVHRNVDACLEQLTEIHQIAYRHIGDDMLWCTSMPCSLPDDDEIPIGQYGSSNIGRAKTVYRTGLMHRYGSRMQTISGIHYNFSLPEAAWPPLRQAAGYTGPQRIFKDSAYFSLIRNFRRHSWLLLYLFGASPAVCGSFVDGHPHGLQELRAGTLYLPAATSLRMSPLGYQSQAQASLKVSYNSLESYARSLYGAFTEPYPQYAAIGIRDGENYLQLSTSLLQIENEFYGTIRPKRRIRSGERPLRALGERGVEYVEVRCMDLDPFSAIGITGATIRFLDVFLLHCLLSDSPPDTPNELTAVSRNQLLVAERGRNPDTRLSRHGDRISVAEWGDELLHELAPVAEALESAHRSTGYSNALSSASAAINDSSGTPSARILRELAQNHDNSNFSFALAKSTRYRDELLALPLPAEVDARFMKLAEESVAARLHIEASDTVPFEVFRQRYVSQDLLSKIRRLTQHA